MSLPLANHSSRRSERTEGDLVARGVEGEAAVGDAGASLTTGASTAAGSPGVGEAPLTLAISVSSATTIEAGLDFGCSTSSGTMASSPSAPPSPVDIR